jgi:hypothetical protein
VLKKDGFYKLKRIKDNPMTKDTQGRDWIDRYNEIEAVKLPGYGHHFARDEVKVLQLIGEVEREAYRRAAEAVRGLEEKPLYLINNAHRIYTASEGEKRIINQALEDAAREIERLTDKQA